MGKIMKMSRGLFFFFFFGFVFCFSLFETTHCILFWLPGKSIFHAGKKSGKVTLPLLKNIPLMLLCTVHTSRDAKGRKVSGNFGNFPWKVSGILKGWEFSEILTYFLHFMRLFAQKSTELHFLCTTFKHNCSALLF